VLHSLHYSFASFLRAVALHSDGGSSVGRVTCRNTYARGKKPLSGVTESGSSLSNAVRSFYLPVLQERATHLKVKTMEVTGGETCSVRYTQVGLKLVLVLR
jgi:hypothetical protein